MTPVAEPWALSFPSRLAHHGAECCTGARAWFLAMDRSLWRGHGAPAWIRRRWEWGPTRWPIHWCEAMAEKELDCGAQAALSLESFRARGVHALPVQLVQRYEAHCVPHWHSRWAEHGAHPGWAADGLVYHEACAVVRDGRAEIWNPTATSWISPENVRGYGSIAAVRIGGGTGEVGEVAWGPHRLVLGEWGAPDGDARPVLDAAD